MTSLSPNKRKTKTGIYSYFEKGCRKKVHATILKGIVGDFK